MKTLRDRTHLCVVAPGCGFRGTTRECTKHARMAHAGVGDFRPKPTPGVTNLALLSPEETRRGLERAEGLRIDTDRLERGPGFVRAPVECKGSCKAHAYLGGWHDVVLWHNGDATCDDGSIVGLCKHRAALLAFEGGALPPAPTDCEGLRCGKIPALWLMGGTGHSPKCPLVDDEAHRIPEPREARSEPVKIGRGPSRWRSREAAQPDVDAEHARRAALLVKP